MDCESEKKDQGGDRDLIMETVSEPGAWRRAYWTSKTFRGIQYYNEPISKI